MNALGRATAAFDAPREALAPDGRDGASEIDHDGIEAGVGKRQVFGVAFLKIDPGIPAACLCDHSDEKSMPVGMAPRDLAANANSLDRRPRPGRGRPGSL